MSYLFDNNFIYSAVDQTSVFTWIKSSTIFKVTMLKLSM